MPIPSPESGAPVGSEPVKQVDPPMHTAEHILTAAIMKMLGCGRPFTTHLEKKKSKADYRFPRNLTPEEILGLETAVNGIISANVAVTEEFLSREEAAKTYNLERLPEEAGDRVRIVRVGDYDACPCSGPHVRTTGEIGAFRIISSSCEEGALRVRFKLQRPGSGGEKP